MVKKPDLFTILCFMLALTIAGCSSAGKNAAKDGTAPQVAVETMYRKAAQSLDAGEYVTAAKEFDEVEQNYPYSTWATKSQIMAAYAYYKELKYDDALLAIDRFIQLHPGDSNISYAYYLKALCYYEQISDVRRDQKMTELALDALKQVRSRFPESKYAKDAGLKIDLALDHIAGKQMEIGRYYLERKHYQAAINRFEKVVEQYQTTTHVAEALHRLTEAYLALGIPAEAKKNAAILGMNYPQSQWYKDSYKLLSKSPEAKAEKTIYDKTLGKIFN